MNINIELVRNYLTGLQKTITEGLQQLDGKAEFLIDDWLRDTSNGGGGRTMVLTDGAVFEQAGVNFSEVEGDSLPASATAHRPELAGCNFVQWVSRW